MNDSDFGIEDALTFECPRCGALQRDDYEVIDLDTMTDWRCASCDRIFSVYLIECPSCAEETAFIALAESEHPSYRDVRCCHCGRRRLGSEETRLESSQG